MAFRMSAFVLMASRIARYASHVSPRVNHVAALAVQERVACGFEPCDQPTARVCGVYHVVQVGAGVFRRHRNALPLLVTSRYQLFETCLPNRGISDCRQLLSVTQLDCPFEAHAA